MDTVSVPENLYAQLDHYRRLWGQQLDTLGLKPLETPSRTVLTAPCLTLKAYPDTAHGQAILLVPAPIKRAYLWDLAPWASVVRRCLAGGLQVYLVQWESPDEAERNFGLGEYSDRLILRCIDAIRTETGQTTVFLAGHSLGGTLTALFAALHPDRVKGLILLSAPLHFGPNMGLFGPIVAVAPPARELTATLGNVPGSVLNTVCLLASPATFNGARWLDWLGSLLDPQALWTHGLVERWTLDELSLPQRLFEEIVEWLYREDRFLQGALVIAGKRVTPSQVTAPLVSVVDKRCQLVPAEAMLPFHDAVSSRDTTVLWYEGDTGVAFQHVGMLVGQHAHQYLWPTLIRWVQTHAG